MLCTPVILLIVIVLILLILLIGNLSRKCETGSAAILMSPWYDII